MKKKSKGKGLSVLSGRALYDYDANLFVVSRKRPRVHAARIGLCMYISAPWPTIEPNALQHQESRCSLWLSRGYMCKI